MVRFTCFCRGVETNLVDDHTKRIDVTRDGGLISGIIGSQQFWCSPIDGCPGQRESIEHDHVQAEVPEKGSWGQVVAD